MVEKILLLYWFKASISTYWKADMTHPPPQAHVPHVPEIQSKYI
jgi:hypothetical protein